jgi:hypothetical protein
MKKNENSSRSSNDKSSSNTKGSFSKYVTQDELMLQINVLNEELSKWRGDYADLFIQRSQLAKQYQNIDKQLNIVQKVFDLCP